MVSTRGMFDSASFYNSLDAVRKSIKLTWKEVANATGVQASTLTRMSQGKKPDVDTLAALADWSGLDPVGFIKKSHDSALANNTLEPLAVISSCLMQDPNLDKASADAIDVLVKTTYERLRKK